MERKQLNDPFEGSVVEQLRCDKALRMNYVLENTVIYRIWRVQGVLIRLLVTSWHMRWEILMLAHDDLTSGHLRFSRSWDKCKSDFGGQTLRNS